MLTTIRLREQRGLRQITRLPLTYNGGLIGLGRVRYKWVIIGTFPEFPQKDLTTTDFMFISSLNRKNPRSVHQKCIAVTMDRVILCLSGTVASVPAAEMNNCQNTNALWNT